MKNLIGLLFVVFISACASKPSVVFPTPAQKSVETEDAPQEIIIDYDGLQSLLKLDRPVEKLGYVEKSFPTCEVGYGYSSNRNCRRDFFVLVHFQLLCRDSNEDSYTEALTAADMRPLRGSSVRWTLSNARGNLNLDDQGRGQIKTTARISQKDKRLKINIGNDNLYVKAGEINKIVTPSNWCN